MRAGSAPNRLTWSTLVFAFIGSVVMYGVLAVILAQSGALTASPVLGSIRIPFMVLGIMSLVASTVWAQMMLGVASDYAERTGDLPTPGQFLMRTIIALALAEVCAILGLVLFFLGAPLSELTAFVVGSAAVMVLFILPKGGAYWRAWESQREG